MYGHSMGAEGLVDTVLGLPDTVLLELFSISFNLNPFPIINLFFKTEIHLVSMTEDFLFRVPLLRLLLSYCPGIQYSVEIRARILKQVTERDI
jgi:hypothetical protein